MKPVASWPDYGQQQFMAMGDDGQLYALPMLEGGRLIATEWLKMGPPLPGSDAALREEFAKMDKQYGRVK